MITWMVVNPLWDAFWQTGLYKSRRFVVFDGWKDILAEDLHNFKIKFEAPYKTLCSLVYCQKGIMNNTLSSKLARKPCCASSFLIGVKPKPFQQFFLWLARTWTRFAKIRDMFAWIIRNLKPPHCASVPAYPFLSQTCSFQPHSIN